MKAPSHDDPWQPGRNEKRAKEAADNLFPCEKWVQKPEYGKRIYVSERRKIGAKTNFKDELRDAEILRDSGSTVYLVSEAKTIAGVKKYDAIVDGVKMEFKNTGGNANTLQKQFLISRTQAPNVFINLETSKLSEREIITALHGARNSTTHIDKKGKRINGYDDWNKFPNGGSILLKISGKKDILYFCIDSFEISK
jgi:hypothetical protein